MSISDRNRPAGLDPAEPPVGQRGHPHQDEQRARLWNPDAVHLLPADRSDHRIIDAERICQAIAALDHEVIQARARQFALLADPTRLTLLICISAAGPISVSDLAAATGINDATVSQTLRHLRA